MWLTIATVLALFDILPARDPVSGAPVTPKIEFESAVIRFVRYFIARFSVVTDYPSVTVLRNHTFAALFQEVISKEVLLATSQPSGMKEAYRKISAKSCTVSLL